MAENLEKQARESSQNIVSEEKEKSSMCDA